MKTVTQDTKATTPFTQKQAYLVHDNLLYRVHSPIIFLGRHPNNNLILTYPTVSRFHARIKYEDEKFVLYDYGSKYGTFVNDEQVSRQELQSGDVIKLADVEILFIDFTSLVIDQIVKEPVGGAHLDYDLAASLVSDAIARNLSEVKALTVAERLETRYQKFRTMGRLGIEGAGDPGRAGGATNA